MASAVAGAGAARGADGPVGQRRREAMSRALRAACSAGAPARAQRENSAKPCATAHGAHNDTSAPSSRRVRTALPSHTPLSAG